MARQTRKQTPKPITTAQIKRIHTIISVLLIDDDTYRVALAERFGVTTCKNLSLYQAQAFIKELEDITQKIEQKTDYLEPKETEKQPERFSNLDNRPGMATPPQLRKIEAMWQDISIVPEPDARNRALRRFVQRIAGVADLRFLDREGASKIINALNAMEKRNGDIVRQYQAGISCAEIAATYGLAFSRVISKQKRQ